jgi:hypothetical protein
MHWCTRVGRRCTLPSSCRTACHRPRSKCSIPAMTRCRLPFRRGSPTGLHLSFRRQWSHHFRRSFRRQWFHHFHLSFRLHPWFRRYWRRDVWARGLGGALRDPADEASGSRYLSARLSLRAIPRSQLQRKALTPKDACCSAWKLTSARSREAAGSSSGLDCASSRRETEVDETAISTERTARNASRV